MEASSEYEKRYGDGETMVDPVNGQERQRLGIGLTPALRRLGGISIAEVLSRVVGLFALPFITRALGPAEFGRLSYVVAITSWIAVASAPGLYSYGLREVAQDPRQVRRTTGELLVLSFSLTLTAYIGIAAYAFLANVSVTDRTLLLIMGATLPISSISISWAFIGMSKPGAVSTLTLATNGMYLALVIWFVKEPGDVILVASLQFLQFTLIAVGLLALAQRAWGAPKLRLTRARALSILQTAIPLGMGAVMTTIYNRIDVIMLAGIRGRTQAGLYGGAYRIMEAGVLLPLILLNTAILPSITAAFRRDPEGAPKKVEVYFRHFLLLAIPVAVGGILLRRQIVVMVLGHEYLSAADVFGVLSLNLLIGGLASLFAGCALVGLRRNRSYVTVVGLGAGANVGLNLMFIPRFGMMAAAAATLAAQFAVAVFALLKVRDSTGVRLRWLRYFLKPLVASVLMGIPVFLLRNGAGKLWLAGITGALTYTVAIIALRAIDLGLFFRSNLNDVVDRGPKGV